MMAGHVDDEPAKKFPTLAVAILCLGMTVTSYTLVSLFPYVGMMVKELLSLETTNEAGECNRSNRVCLRTAVDVYFVFWRFRQESVNSCARGLQSIHANLLRRPLQRRPSLSRHLHARDPRDRLTAESE